MTSSDTTSPKTLVIGLDGGTLHVIRSMVDGGHMPFMASILQRGTSGTLRSTYPPLSPPAWSTFMTGKNPGKHGIFDFITYEDPAAPLRVANSTTVKAETLWSMLSRQGKRVGVVNVPMTYPPQPVNGVMITGVMTPSTEHPFTHPATLYDELRPELGPYVITVKCRGKRVGPFLDQLAHCTRQRGKYVRHLMQRDPWDFFTVVFTETDSLQHALWAVLDPEDRRREDPGAKRRICGYFAELDEEIRRICEVAGEDTRVFFISDHGFGPHLKWLYVNTWLCEQGWLEFEPQALARIRRHKTLQRMIARRPVLFRTLFRLLRVAARFDRRQRLLRRHSRLRNDIRPGITWERTRAYATCFREQGIRINLQGREPHGTVSPGREYEALRDDIIARLGQLRDPDTGQQIIESAWKREDVYSGPHVNLAADVVFVSHGMKWLANVFPAEQILEKAAGGVGTHRLEGMFIAHGPGIRANGTLRDAQLQDLAPTLLYSLREPIPSDMDGRVLAEVFEPEVLAQYQPEQVAPPEADPATAAADYSEEEEKQVIDRLRGLGYVD